jgi:hypothetical protein
MPRHRYATHRPELKKSLPDAAHAGGTRSRYALLVSAILHTSVLGMLSLLVYSSNNQPQSSLSMTIDDADDAAAMTLLPEVELTIPPATRSFSVAASLADSIEQPIQIPLSLLQSGETSEKAAAAAPTLKTQQAVTKIQGRVDKAGGKRGEVQFALAWQNVNDVDLHVIAPSGEHISYSHKRSQCKGHLDVDMNVHGDTTEPVENVRWLQRQAPTGRYTVIVNLFRVHAPWRGRKNPSETDYQLLASLGGESQLIEDAVGSATQLRVHRFQYAPRSLGFRRRTLLLKQMTRLQQSEQAQAEPLLDRAAAMSAGPSRERALREIVHRFPHTDAAIEALKLLTSDIQK